MSKYIVGQILWTWELNVHRRDYGCYQVTVKSELPGYSEPRYEVMLPGGTSEEMWESFLYETQDAAIDAFIVHVRMCREDYKNDILEDTKRIHKMWEAIDYCTEILEEVDQTSQEDEDDQES